MELVVLGHALGLADGRRAPTCYIELIISLFVRWLDSVSTCVCAVYAKGNDSTFHTVCDVSQTHRQHSWSCDWRCALTGGPIQDG